jgi:hypothetical protein
MANRRETALNGLPFRFRPRFAASDNDKYATKTPPELSLISGLYHFSNHTIAMMMSAHKMIGITMYPMMMPHLMRRMFAIQARPANVKVSTATL